MAEPLPHHQHTHEGITVPNNPLSGSADYVQIKQWAAMGDDIQRALHSGSHVWFDIIDGNARAIDSVVATIARYNPLLGAWLPSLSSTTKTARSAFSTVFHLWDTAQREIKEQDWLRSVEHANNMISYGLSREGDDATNQHLNGRLFTHYLDGSLQEAQPQQIWEHFAPGKRDQWPNLVLTSSHALVRDHNDISSTMQGFHALITHCFGQGQERGADLPLIRNLQDYRALPGTGRKHTLMVAAVHNNHNAWVNGGDLLRRLHHLDQLYEAQEQGRNFTQRELEQHYLEGMSPAAVQLSRQILSLIVTRPENVPTVESQAGLFSPAEPLCLRDDAPDILQHIKLVGYSKGGNIVTDAVRHLILQLQHEGSVLVPAALSGPSSAPHGPGPMTDMMVSSLVHNIGILAVNPGICPLTQREKDLGMRRISIRNNQDRISAHLFRKHDREARFGTHDDVYVINGKSMGDLGHGIDASLGTRTDSGYLTDESKVDPQDVDTLRLVRSRLQAFFASCYNHVGISHVYDFPDQPGELEIEFSSGVSNQQIAASVKTLMQAFELSGLQNVAIHCTHDLQRRWVVSFDAPENSQERTELLTRGLRNIHALNPSIFVSGTVYQELGRDPEQVGYHPSRAVDASTAARQPLQRGERGIA